MISIIAAIGKNNELGKDNTLPWRLPADMKHFKEITSGHAVVMGQKTFESIGSPLAGRRNIVMSKDPSYDTPGTEVAHSLEELEKILKNTVPLEEEVFIIGGGQIYKLILEKADRLYITHVLESFPEADTFFPEINSAIWKESSREEHEPDDKNPHRYAFSVYERI